MATKVRDIRDVGQLIAGSEARLNMLRSYLAEFAAEDTPSYSAMANEIGATEAEVKALLGRLENLGEIHFISRNPPRIMRIGPDTKLPHEPGPGDKPLPDGGRYQRLLQADGDRHRLARFIGAYERDHGRPPTLTAMMSAIGYTNPAYVTRMAEILAERGLIRFGRGLKTGLTDEGRKFYGFRAPDETEHEMEQTKEAPKRKLIIVQKGKKPIPSRIDDALNLIAEYQRQYGEGTQPGYRSLAVSLGYSVASTSAVCDIITAAIGAGLVKPKPFKSRGIHFTEKGRLKYMPELVTPTPSPVIPKPIAEAVRRPEPQVPAALRISEIETAELILELIERGYIVKRGQ